VYEPCTLPAMPRPGPDPAQRLAKIRDALEAERQRCAKAQAPLLVERDGIVRQLRAQGWTLRRIAETAGLKSHNAVVKILRGQP
jgi:hypothetical protein